MKLHTFKQGEDDFEEIDPEEEENDMPEKLPVTCGPLNES